MARRMMVPLKALRLELPEPSVETLGSVLVSFQGRDLHGFPYVDGHPICLPCVASSSLCFLPSVQIFFAFFRPNYLCSLLLNSQIFECLIDMTEMLF
jgi:hypothetical protein